MDTAERKSVFFVVYNPKTKLYYRWNSYATSEHAGTYVPGSLKDAVQFATAEEAWQAVRLHDLDSVEVRQFTVTWTDNGAVPRPTTKEHA